MATTTKTERKPEKEKKQHALCNPINVGPGLEEIREVLIDCLQVSDKPKLVMIGNSYRPFPFRITGVEVVSPEGEPLLLNLTGYTDYRYHRPETSGGKYLIMGYDPHSRKAASSVLIEWVPQIPTKK